MLNRRTSVVLAGNTHINEPHKKNNDPKLQPPAFGQHRPVYYSHGRQTAWNEPVQICF